MFCSVVHLFCHNLLSAHVLGSCPFCIQHVGFLYLTFKYSNIFNSFLPYKPVARCCEPCRAECFKTHKLFQLSDRFGNHSSGAEIINVCHCFPSTCLWLTSVIKYSTSPSWVWVQLQSHCQHQPLGSYYLLIRDLDFCWNVFTV